MAPVLTTVGMEFSPEFWPDMKQATLGMGFSTRGFLPPLHTLAPECLFSPCKCDCWERDREIFLGQRRERSPMTS